MQRGIGIAIQRNSTTFSDLVMMTVITEGRDHRASQAAGRNRSNARSNLDLAGCEAV
jgi:hypothetical protein